MPGTRSAIYLNGGGVQENRILPALASGAMLSYTQMFVGHAVVAERQVARNRGLKIRPQWAGTPHIYLSGTPSGSFGLEFSTQPNEDAVILAAHAKALQDVADTVLLLANSEDADFADVITRVPKTVRQGAEKLFKLLAKHKTEIRFALPDREQSIVGSDTVLKTAERFEKQVTTTIEDVYGVFRGVLMETYDFNHMPISGDVITGQASEELTERDLDKIYEFKDKHCWARIEVTKAETAGGKPRYGRELLAVTLEKLPTTATVVS